MPFRSITVYCASSRQAVPVYIEAARNLGRELAAAGVTVVYGGGAVGLMGALADSALAAGGRVIGILPDFMRELEWGHQAITELRIARDMHERKKLLAQASDAAVALPGGVGTLEELMEVISLKRLGLYHKPIAIVNTNDFYRPLLDFFNRCIAERFLDARHAAMWQVVERAEEVLPALQQAAPWNEEARQFAVL